MTSMRAFRLFSPSLEPFTTSATTPDELTQQLPRGLYSTFITNHGGTRVLGLAAHLDRLRVSVPRAGGLPVSASRADLRRALASLAASNAPGESRFRVHLGDSDGALYVILQPFTPLPREVYERGVKVVTAELTRRDPRRKDTGFIAESQSARAKVGGDVFEVLLTHKGKIYEGMTSNFYVVTLPVIVSEAKQSPLRPRGLLPVGRNDGATLVTARQGILLGVTRRAVLRLARRLGMSIEYRAPRFDEDFAEAFLTSSSRGVVPIVSIDGRQVGDGIPGAWTNALSSAYLAYVEARSERF